MPAPTLVAAKRARLLARAWWKGRELRAVRPPGRLGRGAVLCVAVLRDEAARLPRWLDHHRRLGVDRFLLVDNGSTDGTREALEAEGDVALWKAGGSYRAARHGMDWANALLSRHGAGRWCLVIDGDESLVYPRWEERPLRALARDLEAAGRRSMACLMLDLYGDGEWFDSGGMTAARQPRWGHTVVRGGPRGRLLFADAPHRAPVLSKVPFLRWRTGDAFVDSTHFALPRRLNAPLDALLGPGDGPTGALLHRKLLPGFGARMREERARGEHGRPPAYYAGLEGEPDLRDSGSRRYEGWEQLQALGLLRDGPSR